MGEKNIIPSKLPRIRVSDNKRIYVTETGKPFFWLGDTAWKLFHRLSRQQAEHFLKNRSDKRFTVIQAMVLAEFDGIRLPNAYGELPMVDNDPTRHNEAYFAFIDEVIDMAAGLALLPP